jgi:hypothetical protein
LRRAWFWGGCTALPPPEACLSSGADPFSALKHNTIFVVAFITKENICLHQVHKIVNGKHTHNHTSALSNAG